MPFLLYILKKYWLHITLTLVTLSIITFIYFKGRSDCRAKFEKAQNEELQKRWDKYLEDREKIEKTYTNINNHRIEHPLDDKRDSCLLSNNPLDKDCLK